MTSYEFKSPPDDRDMKLPLKYFITLTAYFLTHLLSASSLFIMKQTRKQFLFIKALFIHPAPIYSVSGKNKDEIIVLNYNNKQTY